MNRKQKQKNPMAKQQDDVGITNILQREMKILKICEVIKRQTIPRKIALAFIINIVIVLIVIIISLVIQFKNIQQSQQQIPNLFFKSYNEYSIEEVALRAKNLILASIDFRMNFIMPVRNTILSNTTQLNQNFNTSQIQKYFKKSPDIQNCEIPKTNLSIFSCKMDFYTKFIVESGWKFQATRPVRRFNLIYQNLKDENDIMIKSISNISDMKLTDIPRLNDQFKTVNSTNTLYISSFYKDVYGQSSENLVSFSTQLLFSNYRILIELQTFGTFIKQAISRLTYSDRANIVVLALNDSLAEKYSIVAYYKNPDPDLNYTSLLSKTHAISELPDGQIIYSFSLPFSSSYKIGSLNFINEALQNKNFILIVHSPRITKTMEENTYGLINNLNSTLIEILIVLFLVITIWNITNILVLGNKLTSILNSIKDTITKYMQDPSKYLQAINQLNKQNLDDYLVGFILKSIIAIIKMIEHNKKKFKKKSKKMEKDYYPLNLFEEQFMLKQGILDLDRFEALKLKLIQNQRQIKR